MIYVEYFINRDGILSLFSSKVCKKLSIHIIKVNRTSKICYLPKLMKSKNLGNFGHIWGNLDFDLGIFQDLKVRTRPGDPLHPAGGSEEDMYNNFKYF